MADYTTTQIGNWTDVATWGGSGYPSSSSDTATINHHVTLQTGQTITCGRIDLVGTEFTLNGDLTLAADCEFSFPYVFNVNAGATFNLVNFKINYIGSGTTYHNFNGSESERITITGDGTAEWGISFNQPMKLTAEYTDFSGLEKSFLGRSHTSNIFQTMRHSTVSNCGYFGLDGTGTNVGAGFLVEYCDFTDWSRAISVTPGNYGACPDIYQQSADETTPMRTMRHCTFDNSMNADSGPGLIQLKTRSAIYENNVYNDVLTASYIDGKDTYRYNFFSNTKSESPFHNSGHRYYKFYNNYVYYEQGNHTFTPAASTKFEYVGNIFDNKDGSSGVNWFINPAINIAGECMYSNNVFLGKGNAIVHTHATADGTIYFRNNTSIMDNAGEESAGQYFPIWYMTEQATKPDVMDMHVELYSNLHFDPDDTNTVDPVVDLVNWIHGDIPDGWDENPPDQVSYIDYNMGWSAPNGGQAIWYDDSVTTLENSGVVAPNDFTADPELLDHTRDLKTWHTSLGGDGAVGVAVDGITPEGSVIALLLQKNKSGFDPRYNIKDLVNYVKQGCQPASTSVLGGRYSETCGAISRLKSINVPSINISNSIIDSLNI